MLASGTRIVTVEEHYWDAEIAALYGDRARSFNLEIKRGLLEIGDARLHAMDAAGVDVQVISHGPPATQMLSGPQSVDIARGANDRLSRSIKVAPERFAAFAVLPTSDPAASAEELERAVVELGFKGATICGLANGRFVDTPDFWPIYDRAEQLDVPIYFHPAAPHPAVVDAYYKDYAVDFPGVVGAAWGFTVEAATQAIRLILSGVFAAHPRFKAIFGHMGEALPFMTWRIDQALSRPGQKPLKFREIFRNNFYVTTSGFFSDSALRCTIDELGIDKILFAVDWPFVQNQDGVDWLQALDLPPADKASLAGENACRLLRFT